MMKPAVPERFAMKGVVAAAALILAMSAQRPPVFLSRRAEIFQCLLMCRPDTEM
jgi:hypothetical protein